MASQLDGVRDRLLGGSTPLGVAIEDDGCDGGPDPCPSRPGVALESPGERLVSGRRTERDTSLAEPDVIDPRQWQYALGSRLIREARREPESETQHMTACVPMPDVRDHGPGGMVARVSVQQGRGAVARVAEHG